MRRTAVIVALSLSGSCGAEPAGTDGETRLFIDGEMVVEVTGLGLRPQTDATIDRIWIGGWYSNLGVDPEPAPAVRYLDDVSVCAEYIGP